MGADGSGLVQLTDNSAWDGTPSWSPGGTRIAFASRRDGDREIYTMRADGSSLVQLTDIGAEAWDPSWSPSIAPPEITGIEPEVGQAGETLRVYISGLN